MTALGAIMARAAVHGACLNVKVNGSGLQDRQLAEAWTAEADALIDEAEQLARAAIAVAGERGSS